MNKRIMSIISDINIESTSNTIDSLAEKYQVSQRTIRNDIKALNEVLKEYGLSELKLSAGGVIDKSVDFCNIIEYVDENDFYTYKLSQDERVNISVALLINSPGYTTLSMIAEHLFVSRATVINDLDGIKQVVKSGKLELVSLPNKGLRVEGTELNKRKLLMRLVSLNDNQMHGDTSRTFTSIQAGNQLVIKKIVSEQEHAYGQFLTDTSYQGVVEYLGIMVSRILQGEYIEAQPGLENKEYPMASDILKYIAQYCNVDITENEEQYFADFLSKVRYIRKAPTDKAVVKIQFVTRQFIERVSVELGQDLNNDYDFFENLANHLVSTILVEESEYANNELIQEVLDNNKDIVRAVTNNIDILQQYAGREIVGIERGYIAIHVCAAMERRKNKRAEVNVIVACHAGIGTSQLLLARLKKHFDFRIVDIISAHDAGNVNPDMVDFIITTVPLKNCSVEYVIVSPMLSDEDYLRIGHKIDALRNDRNMPSHVEIPKISAVGLMERISPIIHELAPEKEKVLLKEIRRAVRDYLCQPVESEAEITAPYLHQLLPADHIQLDVSCVDWREAIINSALPLLREGYIERRYIEAMINNIEENGAYIVISQGFALPHEGLEQGSVKLGMNLIRLKKPVSFGAEELDPVEFVCCLSAVDHKMHLKAFFNLVNMLMDDDFKQRLREVATPEEAAQVIERKEYSM